MVQPLHSQLKGILSSSTVQLLQSTMYALYQILWDQALCIPDTIYE